MGAPLDKLAAYHEAGHTVMAVDLDMTFHSVSVIPTDRTRGSLNECRNCGTVDDAFRVLMAGCVASRILCHQLELSVELANVGAEGDLKKIIWLAKRTGCKPSQVVKLWEWTLRRLLRPWLWKQVEAVAEALLEKGKLTGYDVYRILNAVMIERHAEETKERKRSESIKQSGKLKRIKHPAGETGNSGDALLISVFN